MCTCIFTDEMSFRCEIMRDCLYRYYVAVDETTLEFSDVHVEFRRGKRNTLFSSLKFHEHAHVKNSLFGNTTSICTNN